MPAPPDGGPPLVLEIPDSIGAQIGVHYNQSITLQVIYHADTPNKTPVTNGLVRFSIFGDPKGSTLSTDRDATDENGLAQVVLTGGAAEASFRVTASAINAPSVDFAVSVSKLGFVEMRVALAWEGPADQTLRALLYDDRPCAQLPPAPSAPAAFRTLSKTGKTATLDFINLLARSYAVLGRAEDDKGHLLASGCVDVSPALLPAGTGADVPVPLTLVVPSVPGSFTVTTSFTTASATASATTAPWHALTACPLALASELLDATAQGLRSDLATAVASKRGAANPQGCRPGTAGGGDSLDTSLQGLLTVSGAPATQLAGIVADLDALVSIGKLTSHLTIADAGAGTLAAEHALDKLTVGPTGGKQATFDLVAAALPIVDVRDVAISFDGQKLAIGAHGFTLRLPKLWHDAFNAQALGTRFPSLMPPSTRGFLGIAVDAVQRTSLTGCAAVEDLICKTTLAANCTGNVAPACTTALDAVAAQLDSGFTPQTGLDFTLSGQCTATDTDGDLQVDTLSLGTWSIPVADSATFAGTRP
jgi:hypothetical protein